METSFSTKYKCIVKGCTNDIEKYNVEKQQTNRVSWKFRLCSKCKKDKQYRREIIIACLLCGADTGSIQRRICKICRPHWQILINRKNNERHKKPKGNCRTCGVHLARENFGQKYAYCSEKCSRHMRYMKWKARTTKPRYCPICNTLLDPIYHKFKKRFCSTLCWDVFNSARAKVKYQEKKRLNTLLTIKNQ